MLRPPHARLRPRRGEQGERPGGQKKDEPPGRACAHARPALAGVLAHLGKNTLEMAAADRESAPWDDEEAAERLTDHPRNHGAYDGETVSVWFVTGLTTQARLDAHQADLRRAYGGAPAWPTHCTALGEVEIPPDEVASRCEAVGRALGPFTVRSRGLEAGRLYHQDVYVRLDLDASVSEARGRVADAVGVERPALGPYMPHFSLVYGGHTAEQRGAIVDAESTRVVPAGTELRVEFVEVWRCHGETPGWERLARAALEGRE